MLGTTYAGTLVSSVLYGIVIVLFFQCMAALFNPTNRGGEGVKWGFVTYTVVTFSIVSIFTVVNALNVWFDDDDGELRPGRLGYVIPDLMFLLNYWLADGLLLYRCYVIYSMNRWVVAIPFIMYLATIAMGIMLLVSEGLEWRRFSITTTLDFGLPYLSISVSLNVLLTVMIVTRLVLHSRNILSTRGAAGRIGLYRATITMLIESSALYTVNSLVLIGLWGAGNRAADTFLPILAETQVVAPLLIIQRVANLNALTSPPVAPRLTGSLNTGSRGTGGSRTPPGWYPMGSPGRYGKGPGGYRVGFETTIDFQRYKV